MCFYLFIFCSRVARRKLVFVWESFRSGSHLRTKNLFTGWNHAKGLHRTKGRPSTFVSVSRQRQWRRLLDFHLPVFPFLICIAHSHILTSREGAWTWKISIFSFEAEWRLKRFILCRSRFQNATNLSFSRSVLKDDDSWLHSHVKILYFGCN